MEFSSEAGRSTNSPNGKGNSSYTCPHIYTLTRRQSQHICIYLRLHALVLFFSPSSSFAPFTAVSCAHCISLMVHSDHEHQESASLDTAAEYSSLHFLFLSISVFSHLKLSLVSLLSQAYPTSFLCSSLQLCRRHCLCSLCSTFIKGLSSDSPSYNT